MKKVILSTLLVVSLGLFLASCSKDDGPSTPTVATPTITNFNPTSGPVGTVVTINGTNFSTTASSNTVKIGTASATVTTATATRITAMVPQGATTGAISVSVGGKTATGSTFTITEVETPISVTLSSTALTLYPYPQYTGTLEVTSDVGSETIVWSSSDETVATVDQNGLVTPLAAGTTTITATAGTVAANATITVADGPVTNLQLDNSELELFREDQATLAISVLEADVELELTGEPVWNSSNPNVATVDENGNVTAIDAGTTTISVTIDNATAICEVIVSPDVYVLGRTGLENHVVWKNGSEQFLIDAGDVITPTSLSVDQNGLIYVLDEEIGSTVPEVWTIDPTNGNVTQSTTLTDALQDDYSNAVMFVENGNVYVVASSVSGNDNNIVLWINGQLSIPSALENSNVRMLDFFLRDEVPYIILRDEDTGFYGLLTGENLTAIQALQQAALSIESLFVDEDTNVYFLVDHPSLGGLYINGENENLPGNQLVLKDVVAENGTVYVGGQNSLTASIWVNGTSTPQSLPNNAGESSVEELFVSGGQIHAIGSYEVVNSIMAYWKNNMLVEDYLNLDDNNLSNDIGLEAIDIFLR